jgi:hypothetical protein
MSTADSIYNAQSEALWVRTGRTWTLVKPITPLPPVTSTPEEMT